MGKKHNQTYLEKSDDPVSCTKTNDFWCRLQVDLKQIKSSLNLIMVVTIPLLIPKIRLSYLRGQNHERIQACKHRDFNPFFGI